MQIRPPQQHSFRVIAVAQEELTDPVMDIKQLESGTDIYKVHEYFVQPKGEPFPYALLLLATGKKVKEDTIWGNYKKSEKIYFFIVEKV